MFLESAHALCRDGGRMGMIVPSGIYTDNGTKELRNLFLEKCDWDWLWSLINWNKLFTSVYYRFKFAIIIVNKKGKTENIKCGFNKKSFESWHQAEQEFLTLPLEKIVQFSPLSKAILETSTYEDLAIVTKIYENSVLLGDSGPDGWGIQYATEFHMTNDSHLFPPRAWWEERGYTPDEYGRWIPPEGEPPELRYRGKKIGEPGDIALPLYEGRMIGQFDFSEKGWVSGRGRSAKWRDIPWDDKVIEPQFIMSDTTIKEKSKHDSGLNVVFMDVSSATNARSMICSGLNSYPCGNKVPILISKKCSTRAKLALIAILNSFTYDKQLRDRFGGTTLNYFIVEETAVIKHSKSIPLLEDKSARLLFSGINYADKWIEIAENDPKLRNSNWKSLWAVTLHERLRLRCILDAVIAELYGLSFEDFAWILRDCGHPASYVREHSKKFDPKGFWRIEKDQDPGLRNTVLALKAFADLKAIGLDAFGSLNDSDGWMIPETITFKVLADGTIAFDTPDGMTVPVRERLGERFLPWQLEGTPEESWAECEMHARRILGDEEFERMMAESEVGEHTETNGSCVEEVLQKATRRTETLTGEERQQRSIFDFDGSETTS